MSTNTKEKLVSIIYDLSCEIVSFVVHHEPRTHTLNYYVEQCMERLPKEGRTLIPIEKLVGVLASVENGVLAFAANGDTSIKEWGFYADQILSLLPQDLLRDLLRREAEELFRLMVNSEIDGLHRFLVEKETEGLINLENFMVVYELLPCG